MDLNDFKPEETTIWSFKERGSWATHSGDYRGNWSPYVPRNLILRYTNPGDWVLDQFMGSGTTLIEAKLLNRNAVGIDINPQAVKLTEENLRFMGNNDSMMIVRRADAANLSLLKDGGIDFLCTHPPYADIIKYSDGIEGDLSLLDVKAFLGAGFKNKEIIIKEQHNCRSTPYWKGKTKDFLLLAHEYIFVFQK